MGQCVADIDCEGKWSECSSYPNCEKVYNHTIKQSGKGNNCRYRDGFTKKCDDCVPDIDCKGEWSDCSSYPDCEKVYSHTEKQSGKGIDCRFRDGFTKKCDKCESPPPPPSEPGVVSVTTTSTTDGTTPNIPPPIKLPPVDVPPVEITKQKEPVKNKQSVDQSENAEEKSVDNNTSLYILLAILIILQIISFMY